MLRRSTLLLLIAVAILANPLYAEPLVSGACFVGSFVDEFTDQVISHYLACQGEDATAAAICYVDGKRVIMFSQDHVYVGSEKQFKVEYRFDDLKPFWGAGQTFAEPDVVFVVGEYMWDSYLDDLSRAERLIFRYNQEVGRIGLSGADGEALVAEFRQRCDTFNNNGGN